MIELLKNILSYPVAYRQTRKDYKEYKQYYDNFTDYYINEYGDSDEQLKQVRYRIVKGCILSILLFLIPTKVLFNFTSDI